MAAELSSWGSRLFPEKRYFGDLSMRAWRFVRPWPQAALLSAAVLSGAALAYVSVHYVASKQRLADRAKAVARSETANVDLQDALARLRDQLAVTNRKLAAATGQLASVSGAAQARLSQQRLEIKTSEKMASSKAGRIAWLTDQLEQARRDLQRAEAERATIAARLNQSEAQLAGQRGRQAQLEARLKQTETQLQAVRSDRGKTAAERHHSRAPSSAPQEKQSQDSAARQGAPVASVVGPSTAKEARGAEAARSAEHPQARVAMGRERGAEAEIDRVLASAGVDVDRLFHDFGVKRGLGGPFVPVPRGGVPKSTFNVEKLAALHGLIKSLPLATPMLHYRETSAFGERKDPFNGRPAFHPGVDMAAPYGTPVYATGPGVVAFAGWSGGYGKIVEINHGHGIVTRYGHLARYTVLVGEHVKTGTQIGYEGSTGRSTGPHVIYEVDVNGEPQDPAKFIELGERLRRNREAPRLIRASVRGR